MSRRQVREVAEALAAFTIIALALVGLVAWAGILAGLLGPTI